MPTFSDEIIKLLEDTTYKTDDAFRGAKSANAGQADLDQLSKLSQASEDAYWHAVNQNLKDDNDVVKQFKADLQSTNQKITQMLTGLQSITQLVALVTEAVKLAASLASLAASA